MLSVFNYRLLRLNLFLIIIAAAVSFYFTAAVPLLFLLLSNLFDIFGYHFTLIRKENKLPEKDIVHSYRIIQLMFDIILFAVLALMFGTVPAICGVVLKLFAWQDLMYYFFLKEKLPLSWNWLTFTPLGFMKKILTLKEVLAQAAAGLVITILIFLLMR